MKTILIGLAKFLFKMISIDIELNGDDLFISIQLYQKEVWSKTFDILKDGIKK